MAFKRMVQRTLIGAFAALAAFTINAGSASAQSWDWGGGSAIGG